MIEDGKHHRKVDAAVTKLLLYLDKAGRGKAIKAGEGGLTREDLRALERAGWVERLRTETRKWKDVGGTIQYAYRLVKRES